MLSLAAGLLTALVASTWALIVAGGMSDAPEPRRVAPSSDIRTW
ncbi:hypothetical protein Q8W71_16530 [Methylobacterium sp. NEAU 140]|nr:hypothetical protein [Methylobacterium sp. NEAU 140]MDP4024237.1 hypothetical protein [Methylobacterium sp. NEAU 140]